MLQNTQHPGAHMSLKAAEASSLLGFAILELNKYGGAAVFGTALVGAGGSLKSIIDQLKAAPVIPSPDAMRSIMASLDMHLLSTVASGMALTPKHHLLAHMLHRSGG
eukprot:471992-Pyramimonas_sp.AAC.1